MSFHIGQRVICVNDTNGTIMSRPVLGCGYSAGLRNGAIYNIRSVENQFLYFAELKGGWRATRFRPIIERKTEVSFTEGAPKDSEKFDNRRRVKVLAPSGANPRG